MKARSVLLIFVSMVTSSLCAIGDDRGNDAVPKAGSVLVTDDDCPSFDNTAKSPKKRQPSKIDKLFKEVTKGKVHPNDKDELFEAWLKKKFQSRAVTFAEVCELLGKPIVNLDRPKTENQISYQWSIHHHTDREMQLDVNDFWMLYMDFSIPADPNKATLIDLNAVGVSVAICGFCPHILVPSTDPSVSWHLEGKMLAGRIGQNNSGQDLLVLPRFLNQSQMVIISNPAPEIEYLNSVNLGRVIVDHDQQIDVGIDHKVYSWKDKGKIKPECPISEGSNLLILSLRNTSSFERSMRKSVSKGNFTPLENSDLICQFDTGEIHKISPVGTKLLRRVVIPIPRLATSFDITNNPYWYIARINHANG